ncbi:molybdate ABC transporter substrate-binding protein [Actinoplanes sp. GCM10030250]|uniref:molybdate ABC transporter substrate-binding protein n=1 Tax=Actinoplanes sp. GCM10030250 TaxID=3273376 RepID=UPI003612D7AC
MRAWRAAAAGLSALAIFGLGGCGGAGPDQDPGSGTGESAGAVSGSVTVFAAASLTESFTTIGEQFEAAHPGTTVTFNFGGSSGLATQINEGAPADVFASASPKNLVTGAGPPAVFARNQLVIAVAKGNPAGVTGLAGLSRAGLKVALCAEAVPCGAAANTVIEAAGVAVTPVTLEQDVKAALSKLKLGEVDAALVYRTDAKASAADVDAVEFPESAEAVNDYPIVVLNGARNPAGARAFVDYVLSGEGTKVLTGAGFQAP